MTARRDELIKQAYAYGASIALHEAGVSEEIAIKEAAALATVGTQPQDQVELQKQAYLYGVAAALNGVTAALKEKGVDEKTASDAARQWVNF